MPERVVITGMGTVSPLGLSVKETWEQVLNGVSGVAPITLFDTSNFLVKIACEVKGFIPENYLPAKEVRRRERFQQFATVAAKEAITQAGLEMREDEAYRVGMMISSSIGGLQIIQDAIDTMREEGPRRISPFAIPMFMPNGAASLISMDYKFRGPSFTVGSACASSADAIGIAWLMIRSGILDAAITGGSESTVTAIGVGAFDRMGAMSHRPLEFTSTHPSFDTPKPFDKNRDGLVMGEGSAILVLESESHARGRDAHILAELAGYASTSDAFHITAPDENGTGGANAIRLALEAGRINPEEVDYINAHGTATPLNDLSETRAIKAAFGKFAYNIPVSSTKSMTGHMMGTTATLEAIFCVQAICQGAIPPTINYQTPDPLCDLDYVPNQARSKAIRVAISNAFGFGGHNSVLAIRSYE